MVIDLDPQTTARQLERQAGKREPFAGSGSTLIAAKSLGRDYLGIELDAKYHAIARQRLDEASRS